MDPKKRNTSPMSYFGNQLPDWDDVRDENGARNGSDHRVVGGTEHYDNAGKYSGFTDNEGNDYDAQGNRT